MWPFTPSKIQQTIDQVLAPGALPSAREKSLVALMALPQKPESLKCYSQIALDAKQVWKVRYKAMEGMKLSQNVAGARALLACVGTDMRSVALGFLSASALQPFLQQIASETMPVFSEALRQIAAEVEKRFNNRLLEELQHVRSMLRVIDTPDANDLLAEVSQTTSKLQNGLVPEWLECALKSGYHQEVKDALAALERLGTAESKAALEKFRGVESRLVKKYVVAGVGATIDDGYREVYTSEFGQPKCKEEIARHAQLEKEWQERHPQDKAKTESLPQADDADVKAASDGGINLDLVALVHDQLGLLKALHRKNSLAPLAATMDLNGEIHGFALTSDDFGGVMPTVEEAVALFQQRFRAAARKDEIRACAVFYHGCRGAGQDTLNFAPALSEDDAGCFVALVDHSNGQAYAGIVPYLRNWNEEWEYGPTFYHAREREIFSCGDAGWLEQQVIRAEVQRWCRRGKQLLRDEEASTAEAETCFNYALEMDPLCGEALIFKAAFLREAGRHEEAIAHCDRAMALGADRLAGLDPSVAASLWRNKALSFHALERFEEEQAVYDHVLATDASAANSPEIWGLKGAAWLSCGQINGALACFQEAERLGHQQAAHGVNVCWQFLAESSNDAEAQYQLGRRHYGGEGMPEDHAEAARWFRKAAEQGHADAQRLLGLCYAEGDGVPMDAEEAAKWIRKADEQDRASSKSMALKSEPHPVEGGLYCTQDDDGHFSILKVLKQGGGAVHVRLYGNRLTSPPAQVDESTLFLGVGHAPISEAGFQGWKATFIQQSTVEEDELEGYRLWMGE
ncbi:tetratricopeptide/SEL1-like repeat protein [Prosthecobacter sp.]|uniref:SEL1-like repeat protein n=1 Tax=Prosthecobacter sp. TaxID=1965333 RepID=UPI002ABADC34|nr:tetratricopeptide/SEL1-like repeat protein [Prosthecobacter sp.]MDZ4403297.1 tetratricopeptide/SEL1-like repeat protein [Prosthecobacter sp.]